MKQRKTREHEGISVGRLAAAEAQGLESKAELLEPDTSRQIEKNETKLKMFYIFAWRIWPALPCLAAMGTDKAT